MSEGPSCTEAQFCRADFYYLMAKALKECGDDDSPAAIERYQKMPLCEVVDVLAQNGIRMVYRAESHTDALTNL